MPVMVVKHCMRKFSVSSTSRPDGGSGLLPGGVASGMLLTGLRREVIAWTLDVDVSFGAPMQNDKVILERD